MPRKQLTEQLLRVLPTDDVSIPDHITLVNVGDPQGSLLATRLQERQQKVISTLGPADIRAAVTCLVSKIQKLWVASHVLSRQLETDVEPYTCMAFCHSSLKPAHVEDIFKFPVMVHSDFYTTQLSGELIPYRCLTYTSHILVLIQLLQQNLSCAVSMLALSCFISSVKMQALRCSLDKVIVCNACHRIDSARKASTRFRCEFQDLAVQCTYTGYMNVNKWRHTRS